MAFAAISKGNAGYMKLQKELHDAYFNPVYDEYDSAIAIDNFGQVTVPDNCTLYVPNGV